MKTKYQLSLFSLLLLMLLRVSAGFAQSTSITCHISGSRETDSVLLFFFPKKWGSTSVGMQRFVCTGKQEQYRFQLPPIKEPFIVTLGFQRYHKTMLFEQWIEPGDSLVIKTDTAVGSVSITGRNAAKNNLQKNWQQWRREKNNQGFWGPDAIVASRYTDPQQAWEHITGVFARERTAWEQMAAPFQDQISPLLFHTLRSDINWQELGSLLGYFNETWETSFTTSDGEQRRQSLREFYERKISVSVKKQIEASAGTYPSPVFLNFAVRKTMTDARIEHNSLGPIESIRYLPFLQQWSAASSDMVNTALVTYLYSYTPNASRTDKLVAGIVPKISNPDLIRLVRSFQQRFLPGSPMYPFELKDEKGKIWTAAELNNKTIVMDFWFNGCTACIKMAKLLRIVKARLGNRDDLVFVSVSIDPTRERWISGLQSGLYTDPDNINLFTDGLASEHPFAKNYEVTACPRLLIFSKGGKLWSSDMPRSGPNLVAEFTSLIEQAAK